MKPLLTPVGVTMKRSGPRRAEMLPPLPSQYSRIQMRRPMSQICSLSDWASGELKSRASRAGVAGAGAAGCSAGTRGRAGIEDDFDSGLGEGVFGAGGEAGFAVVAEFFRAGFDEGFGVFLGEQFHNSGL